MKFVLLILFISLQISTLDASEGSVVCVHGFIRSYKCMLPMGNTLEKEGLDVYLWDYPTRRHTIQEHADNLVEVLNQIALKNPGKPIHFVTHSLGGVIVKTALNHPECPKEAKMGRAVLLAPPMHGSTIARSIGHLTPVQWFFGSKAGNQLLTYSPEDVADLGDFPDTIDVMVIAGKRGNRFFFRTPNDGKVAVHETHLNTPHEHLSFFVSHNWIMTSRQVITVAKNFLLK